MSNPMGRRDFMKIMGATGLVAATGGAVFGGKGGAVQASGNTPVQQEGMGAIPWEEMDLHHQEGVDKFLANIGKDPDFWGKELEYEMDGDVKVFRIVCQEVDWEVEPGVVAKAMTYNGIVPGPVIHVTEGDTCRFIVTNEMSQSTAIHWHGLLVPNDQDGVPMVTQDAIIPGGSQTYEFTLRNSGSHIYHSHYNSAEQTTRGMLGAFIVDPKDTSREPKVDADYIFVMNDSGLGTYTFNGKSFPYTQPIIAKFGDKIRIRYYNEGFMIHPMHLHGIPQLVFAKDGINLPVPFMCDTINVAPGERYDVLVDCNEPGIWAFHCHILNHAEGPYGMFGMVTVLIVQN